MKPQMVTDGGVRIRFKHEHGDPVIGPDGKGHDIILGFKAVPAWTQKLSRRDGNDILVPISRRVICTFTQPIPGKDREYELVGEPGYAYCSPLDLYDAEIGRQVALFEARKSLPKILWGEVMAAYIKRIGAKPWMLDQHGHPKPGAVRASRG